MCNVPSTRWPVSEAVMASGDRFQIAHFTDHDDIGIFAERTAQGRAKRQGVGVHLALGDVAALRFEHVLDRIFERDDVLVPFHG